MPINPAEDDSAHRETREERERSREMIIGLTLWDRLAGDRLRDPSKEGNPHDPEYAQIVEEAGGGIQPGAFEAGLQRLRGLATAAECEPWLLKAEQYRTQRFRRENARLETERTLALPEGHARVVTAAAQHFDRFQQNLQKFRDQPPNEVRESEGGSTSTTTPNVEELLAKLRLKETITPQVAAANSATKEGRKDLAEYMARHTVFITDTLTELASVLAGILNNQRTTCIRFNERSATMEQLLTNWVPQMDAQTQHMMRQLETILHTQAQIRRDLDEATAEDDMMQGIEDPNPPLGEQLLPSTQPLSALMRVPALGQPSGPPMMVPAQGQQPSMQAAQQQPGTLTAPMQHPGATQPTGHPAAAGRDDLPPGLQYCMVGGEVCVCLVQPPAGAPIQPIPYSHWVEAVKARVNPFEPDRPSGSNGPTNKVRLPNPKAFSGEAGDTDPDLAILAFETWLEAAGIPENRWAAMGQSFLSGAAHRAYSAVALAAMAKGQTPTWEEVRTVVKSFRRQDVAAMARAKLASMKQTGTVAAYNRAFSEQLAQVGSEPPAAPDLLRYYLNGLSRVQILSPQGQMWGSLQSAMDFHLHREMAEISVRPSTTSTEAGQKRGAGTLSTGRPLRFHRSLKPRLRLISSQTAARPIPPRTPGLKRSFNRNTGQANNGAGTSRNRHGDANTGAGPSRARLDDAALRQAFGLPDKNLFFKDLNENCPAHTNCARPHTKGSCGEWLKICRTLANEN
jgi:hypothetical protein